MASRSGFPHQDFHIADDVYVVPLKPGMAMEWKARAGGLFDANGATANPRFVKWLKSIRPAGDQNTVLCLQTCDDFFASGFVTRNKIKFDLAFFDGLHHDEALLRDFINTES